jgi:hypothetical protein
MVSLPRRDSNRVCDCAVASRLIALALLLVACNEASPSAEEPCEPGDTRACECGPVAGTQLCRLDETYETCRCSAPQRRASAAGHSEQPAGTTERASVDPSAPSAGPQAEDEAAAGRAAAPSVDERDADAGQQRDADAGQQRDADAGAPGPAEAAARCCVISGAPLGTCLSRTQLPPALPLMAALECSRPDHVCVPDSLRAPSATGFPACAFGPDAPGACVPGCLIDPALAPALTRGSCATEERCVPCAVMGQPTGACGSS